MEDLFTENRDNNDNVRDKITGPPITRDEVKKAIHMAKIKKATGPNKIRNSQNLRIEHLLNLLNSM